MTAELTIGEFSVMTQLSKKALRHYHELGLLEPAHIDRFNGYRRYDTQQVSIAHIIRRFRNLGLSVPDIKAVLATDDVVKRNAIIASHLQQMEDQLLDTQRAVAALRELLAPNTTALPVSFRSVPVVPAWAITDLVNLGDIDAWFSDAFRELRSGLSSAGNVASGPSGGLYAQELFSDELGEVTVFIPTQAVLGATGRVRVVEIPAAEVAVAVHRGTHAEADRTYGALGTYVTERLLSIDGPVRENYLEPDGHTGEAVTEICWPVFRTSTG
ncbi:MAG: DNA-binding transcriptional regulator, MerR family [Frankiales bacterium]|nr:DNA-binding transcriptional regulator, MerR family [Frankiales bacterium]